MNNAHSQGCRSHPVLPRPAGGVSARPKRSPGAGILALRRHIEPGLELLVKYQQLTDHHHGE